ncbi:MAG TPA: protein kinase, partial [Acidimicrobiales bacterium]|nr:protein kinase [Acidimicrobiales bacterium]
GTARYLAPEQVEGTAVDGRTDVYALGVVLYEMACGQPPFDAGTDLATAMCHLTQEPEALAERCPDVPPALAAVAHRAMVKDPADRWPTARAMADALVDLADDAVPLVVRDPTPPAGIRPVARRRRRRGTGVAGAVAVVALAGAIAAGLLVRDADPRRRDRAAADGPLAVATVRSFDPLGDQRENDDGAGAAVDGNPATAWATDRYRTRHFGGLKPGVGLVIELETDHPLRELRLLVGATGWAGAVYVADDPPATLDDWGEPAGRVGAGGVDLTVPLGGRRGRAVLLWITDLGDGPGRRRFEVREAAVMGT